MALFKCKMCGGDLEIAEGLTTAACEYCGTTQTVPKATDENLQNLFNRANTLRIKSEFDKAEKLYEKIIQSDSTQADAYWGLILCKYGIEYVDDPKTFKKIPTCHRASYDSIIADDDYKSALEHADLSQRSLYEEQAKEIDRIQKDILALAQKEETYDVFICYKETDNNGQRTQDSVVANDIYYQLTQEGFRVFYAAITLEDKLGSAYEPIIFAALSSAKVMLAIGTKPEYFGAVWVKNEWSRFLKMMKKDRSKLLIPCYRDMDAYELPEEFAHLQAQDMSKIGFINDLVRGIRKVMPKEDSEPTTVVKEPVVTAAPAANASVAPLLKRAVMFLEDGEWERADDFCEQVLNIDPECAEAYLGKLMAELKVRKRKALADRNHPFDHNKHYQKAMRFADKKLREELSGYIQEINLRNQNNAYQAAQNAMRSAESEYAFKSAAEQFEALGNFKDAKKLAEKCLEAAENARLNALYKAALTAMREAGEPDDYTAAAKMFDAIASFRDAKAMANECRETADGLRKDRIYNGVLAYIAHNTLQSYENAAEQLKTISGWKDADELLHTCEQKIEDLKVQAVLARQEAERLAEEKKIAEQKAAMKRKKRRRVIALVLAVIMLLSGVGAGVWYYNSPLSLFDYTALSDGNGRIDGIKSDRAIVDGVVTIPDSMFGSKITYIGANAFANSQIKEVVFPKTITYISTSAFNGASSMQKISYAGTAVEWGTIQSAEQLLFQNFEVTHTGDCSPIALNAVAPTCTVTGLTEGQICRVCKKVIVAQSKILANGHTSVTDVGVAPTCTENGISDGSHCEVCGEVLVAQEELMALNPAGHTWKFSEVLSVATCTEPGTEKFVCEMCGVEEIRTVSGHEFDNWETVAMCAEEENRTCTLCGATESRRIAPLTAHNYGKKQCTVCGAYKPSEGLEFSADGVVLGMGTCKDTVLVIPAVTPDGITVTEIGYEAFEKTGITSVIIPNCVTTIGNNAFYNCDALTNVTIGNSVTAIGSGAFYACDALTSITIPDSVTTIGNAAFSNCDALTNVTIPDSVTTIGNTAFSNCDALTNVTIPDSVTTIGNNAFSNCDALTSITIPDSVTTIGDSAFSSCGALTSVTIPDSVIKIGDCAFYNCDTLTSVTIGNNVAIIGDSAFNHCDVLKRVIYDGAKDRFQRIWLKPYCFKSGVVVTCSDGTLRNNGTRWVEN